jgi:nucleoside-diphosphate-sugar epimerase
MPSEDQVLGTEPLTGRILLTGATGRVGARLVPLLRTRGAEVRLMIWGPAPAGPQRGSVVMGDLCDPGTCREAVEGAGAVVHIASAFVGMTIERAADVNYRATSELASAAAAAGTRRFVQMSSFLVYEPGQDRPAREDDEPRAAPGSPFAAAKLASEQALRQFAGSALGTGVLRVAFTYGEGDPHLLDALTWAARARPDARLGLVHHADVRQGIVALLRREDVAGGTFNLADDTPVRAGDLARFADGFQPRGPADQAAEQIGLDGEQFGGLLDTTAARERLGFRPIHPSIQAAGLAGKI